MECLGPPQTSTTHHPNEPNPPNTQEMLLYATLIEDVERVVALYLQDHHASKALAVSKRFFSLCVCVLSICLFASFFFSFLLSQHAFF